uniref:Transketolase n=1 Tax=Cyprinus carpio TaxID=7962 RepID=A0A8C2G9K2_CYPCA
MSYHKPDEKTLQALKDIANKLRIHSIKQTCASNSGHPTSCCSAADLMSVLFFHTMRYKADDPRNHNNDRFILSKGHAAPLLYAAWAEVGFIKESELLNLRKIDCDLEGHPTPKLAFVDVATGSLGQGLGAACGMAYTGKYFDKASYRVYCMMGDGECSEGSVWEAMAFASYYKLDNLVAIIDVNRLGQSEAAPLQHNMNIYKDRCEAFGAKGSLISFPFFTVQRSLYSVFSVDLKKMGNASPRVVALNGDTKNSTFSDIFKKDHPDRFIECFIAEQNMVSVAIGCATRNRTVSFASTFAAFFARAYDHIRMAAISQSNINLVGSHCGVSIGEDGPSQMALEDLAMFRAIPTCTVFYPSDGVSTERAVELAANTKGICFIRTSRPDTAVIYDAGEKFEVGKAKVVRQSDKDQVTVIGAGVTLHEALAAHDQLAKEGVNIRIIDPFTIKPLDASTIVASARATGGRVITVEDHYKEGGLGEAVLSAVGEEPGIVVHRLAVSHVPHSGKPQELLDMFGISAKSIVAAVKQTFAN